MEHLHDSMVILTHKIVLEWSMKIPDAFQSRLLEIFSGLEVAWKWPGFNSLHLQWSKSQNFGALESTETPEISNSKSFQQQVTVDLPGSSKTAPSTPDIFSVLVTHDHPRPTANCWAIYDSHSPNVHLMRQNKKNLGAWGGFSGFPKNVGNHVFLHVY